MSKKLTADQMIENAHLTADQMIDENGDYLPNTGYLKTRMTYAQIETMIDGTSLDLYKNIGTKWTVVNFTNNGKRYTLKVEVTWNASRDVILTWDHRDDMSAVMAALTPSDLWEGGLDPAPQDDPKDGFYFVNEDCYARIVKNAFDDPRTNGNHTLQFKGQMIPAYRFMGYAVDDKFTIFKYWDDCYLAVPTNVLRKVGQ